MMKRLIVTIFIFNCVAILPGVPESLINIIQRLAYLLYFCLFHIRNYTDIWLKCNVLPDNSLTFVPRFDIHSFSFTDGG